MAKVNFGSTVNDARGKIAGTVYSRNSSGAYIRTKVTPVNPATGPQKAVRSSFATLSKNWSSVLTPDERGAWNTFATTWPKTDVFGNSVTISGMNYYIALNQRLAQIDEALITMPPSSLAITPIPIDPSAMIADPSIPSITYEQTAVGTTGLLFYVFGAKPLPAGRKVTKSDYRYIGHVAQSTSSFPAAKEVGSLYTAVFGSFLAGQSVNLLVATIDPTSGVVTVGQPLQAIAAVV